MCKSILKGQNVPRDRRDISRDRWDVSPGQTGRTPGGVPPKFFMFIGYLQALDTQSAGVVGGQNRVDLSFSFFPCFAVFGGS